MSGRDRRDRGALVVLALTILAIVAIAFIENLSPPPSNQRALWGLFTPDDTYAQWLMVLTGMFATGFSIWGVLLLRDTLRATREATIDNRRIGQAQTRAYLHVSGGRYKSYWIEDDIFITLQNTGASPAMDVKIEAVLFSDFFPAATKSTALFPTTHRLHTGSRIFGNITASSQRDCKITIWSGDMDSEALALHEKLHGGYWFRMTGTVTWRDVFDEIHSETFNLRSEDNPSVHDEPDIGTICSGQLALDGREMEHLPY